MNDNCNYHSCDFCAQISEPWPGPIDVAPTAVATGHRVTPTCLECEPGSEVLEHCNAHLTYDPLLRADDVPAVSCWPVILATDLAVWLRRLLAKIWIGPSRRCVGRDLLQRLGARFQSRTAHRWRRRSQALRRARRRHSWIQSNLVCCGGAVRVSG